MGYYSPPLPSAWFYPQPSNPGKYDVWLFGQNVNLPNTPAGTKIVTGGTDPQGDTARAIIALGLARNTATYSPSSVLGAGHRDAEVTYATGKTSRRFGLLKLINGVTGRSAIIDIMRAAKRTGTKYPQIT